MAQPIYQTAQIRELEQLATLRFKISAQELMERAGAAALAELLKHWPAATALAIFVGGGNNGGDGYVLAWLAFKKGISVKIWQVGDINKLKKSALFAYERCVSAGISMAALDLQSNLEPYDVLVDAILGIGIQGKVRDAAFFAIEKLNRSGLPIFSIDIPSGIDADTGCELGIAIKSTATVTFIGLKLGLLTHAGIANTGKLTLAHLLPSEIYPLVNPVAEKMVLETYRAYLNPRPRNWHKGKSGHVLIVGGDYGYSGAVVMAAEAALRAGAGLVSIATREGHAKMLNLNCPEIMSHAVETPDLLQPLCEKARVIVLGPGLGRSSWAMSMYKAVLATQCSLVVDADGLNLLAEHPEAREQWVLTPHPGEAARLLNLTVEEIQNNRLAAVEALQNRFRGVCVLKSAGTLIACPPPALPFLCDSGNPGMATAGMGDILSGIIGGLIAQMIPLNIAAQLGVCLHAAAGDLAAKSGERGMLATDLLVYLRELVNPRC